MGSTEYCNTLLLPKPSQKLPPFSLLEPGIADCKLPWVFSKRKLFQMEGRVHLEFLEILQTFFGIN
jgi:hypothetical protein